MTLLTIPELILTRAHDALCIFGCGYSINYLTPEEWATIDANYDTYGMSWYCKKRRPTTYYMVREQCSTPKRMDELHNLEGFYEDMAYLKSSVKVIKDTEYRANNYQHSRHIRRLEGRGYVFNEIFGGCSVKSFKANIFDDGIHHGKCSMYDALHFAVGMGYEKILFCGVDLYDSRCFYLPYKETLPVVLAEGRTCETPHLTADKTVRLVKDFSDYWKIPLFVHNPKSLLAGVIPVWDNT